MEKKQDGWSVVLAGFWNRMIFTPEWVIPHLFSEDAQIETLVALLPVLPIIYRDSQIAVEISSVQVVCRARNPGDDAALRRSGTIAGVILQTLPETPVQGVGINFAFREVAPVGGLLDLFNFGDNARLAQAEWQVGERKIVRRLSHDDDTLNLTLTFGGGQLDIDCNFHTDFADRDAAIAALSPDRIIQLKERTITMLDELYGLQLEENHGEV
jgi:hypothetical protein